MLNKKSFKNNPAMTFINTQEDTQHITQQPTHDDAHKVEQEDTQHIAQQPTHDDVHEVEQESAQQDTQHIISHIRTQGRKGYKKPRINLAFDSEEFLDEIRTRADKEGMSITQLVNEATAYYLKHTKPKKRSK